MEPCEFTYHLQAKLLRELGETILSLSPERLEAFQTAIGNELDHIEGEDHGNASDRENEGIPPADE
jgi:hypothetical protein